MDQSFKPAGWPDVVPRLLTPDVDGLVDFLRTTFGAQGESAPGRPAEMWIGDAVVLVSDGGGVRDPSPAFLYVYVADTDRAYAVAVKAGAETIEAPSDMPWGDRRATVKDRWGKHVATRDPQGGLPVRRKAAVQGLSIGGECPLLSLIPRSPIGAEETLLPAGG